MRSDLLHALVTSADDALRSTFRDLLRFPQIPDDQLELSEVVQAQRPGMIMNNLELGRLLSCIHGAFSLTAHLVALTGASNRAVPTY